MQANQSQRRAALYLRISKDSAGEGLGVLRQEDECRELVDRLGWTVADVYSDNDYSATSSKVRPAYTRMLEDIRNGQVSAVVAWHTDRLTRRPQELEQLIELADKHGVVFSTVKSGELDLSTSTGQFVARLLGAAARHEAMLKGERQASKARQRAHAGLPTGGGHRPFGYEPGGMTIREREAEVIRALAQRALGGESVFSMCQWLTDHEVPTVTGGRWTQTVLRNVLSNPRLAGIATYKGQVVGKGQWQPILDETTSGQLGALLRTSGRARAPRVSLLAGRVVCGICEFDLVTWWRGSRQEGVRTYGCRTRFMPGRSGYKQSCGRISVIASSVEEDVAARLLGRILRANECVHEVADSQGNEPLVGAAAELGAAESRLQELGRDFADGIIGRTEFLAARDRLAETIGRLQRQVSSPQLKLPRDAASLTRWWERATLSQRQIVVSDLVAQIEVGPHTGWRAGYDPTRVTISWR